MRKIAWLLLGVLLGISPGSARAQFPLEKFYVQGSLVTGSSVAGHYTQDIKTPDMLESGVGFDFGLGIQVSDHYKVSSSLVWLELPFKKEYRPNKKWRPTFEVPAWLFTNQIQFTVFNVAFQMPVGVGIYYWRFTENGRGSDALRFEGQALEKMSFGVHGGLGIEFEFFKPFNFFVSGTYHYIFSKDRFLFGEGFSEQGIAEWKSGIRWYFSTKTPLKP